MIRFERVSEMRPELVDIHHQGFDPGWSTTTFEEFLAKDAVRLFCAFEGDRMLSFVLVSYISPQCEILTFATAQSERRKGAGRALFAYMFDAMRRDGAEEVFLEVATDNDAARGLYQSLGFTQVGLRKSYYARRVGYPVDALVLSCDLKTEA
jgi:[ribosomal protein S18]-alanine N-acetyltransferase